MLLLNHSDLWLLIFFQEIFQKNSLTIHVYCFNQHLKYSCKFCHCGLIHFFTLKRKRIELKFEIFAINPNIFSTLAYRHNLRERINRTIRFIPVYIYTVISSLKGSLCDVKIQWRQFAWLQSMANVIKIEIWHIRLSWIPFKYLFMETNCCY